LIERYNLQQYDNEVLGIERTTQDPVKPVEKTTDPVVEQPKSVPAPVQSSVVTNAKTHVVVKGDTLYSLSKKYGISIDELKQKNALLENSISIGQELIIQ